MKINKRILRCEYAEIVPASYMPDAETQERLNPNRITYENDRAIELNPQYAEAYNNRGWVWFRLREWEEAEADLRTAKGMGADIVTVFYLNYESIETFEAKHSVKVPEDLAALLRRDEN